AAGNAAGAGTRIVTESELHTLIEATASDLRRRFGVENDTPTRAPSAQRSLPVSYEARRLYVEGIDALLRWDARTARDLFERSIVLQPDFPLAHARLSSAWSVLGYDHQAQGEAAAAVKLADRLPSEERRWVEAQYREMSRDWPAAIEGYLTPEREFPD